MCVCVCVCVCVTVTVKREQNDNETNHMKGKKRSVVLFMIIILFFPVAEIIIDLLTQTPVHHRHSQVK